MKKTKANTDPDSGTELLDELLAGLVLSEDRLAESALNQPVLFAQAAKWRVEAIRKLAMYEGQLKTLKAEKSLEFRRKADAEGDKVTEAGMTARIEADAEVVALAKKLRNATALDEYSNLIVQAYRARGNSIRVIADLKSAEVYHGQRVAYQSEMEETRERVRKKFPGGRQKDDD